MLALGANTHRPTVGSRCIRKESRMFIAMNRFRVKKGSEEAFEKVWLSRDTHLAKVPGFVEFHLLKGPEHEDFTLYASHSVWQSRAAFEAWTRSAEFRATSTTRASFARWTPSVTATCSAALVANPHCGLKPNCSSLM